MYLWIFFNCVCQIFVFYCPIEFNRKTRSLNCLKFWKATEYRSFLLYFGLIVSKDVVNEYVYDHFMLLFVSARLLCDKFRYKRYASYCDSLLRKFVQDSSRLYGTCFLTYNVHTLIHLAQLCNMHGHCESFAAFPFENYLGNLKNMLRSKRYELQQIVNRLFEKDCIVGTHTNNSKCKYIC